MLEERPGVTNSPNSSMVEEKQSSIAYPVEWFSVTSSPASDMLDPYMHSIHNTVCHPYLTLLELFYRCKSRTTREALAEFSSGVAAVMLGPIVIISSMGNLLLIALLLCKIRRPRKLELWGIVIALQDLVFLTFSGWVDTIAVFGTSWWGEAQRQQSQMSHLSCKLFSTFRCFLDSVRVNFLFFLTLQNSRNTRVDDFTDSWILPTFLCIVISMILACVQAAPAFMIYGLRQNNGVFDCFPDFQIHYIYQTFFSIHEILFIDGLLQSICAMLIGILVFRRLYQAQQLVNRLSKTQLSHNLISVIIVATDMRLTDASRNMRIILSILYPTVFSRLTRMWFRGFSVTGNLCFQSYPTYDTRLNCLTQMSIWNLVMFVEVFVVSFGYLCWYIHLPDLQRPIEGWYRIVTGCIDWKKRSLVLNTISTNYFQRSCAKQDINLEELTENRSTLEQLDALKKHLNQHYDAELAEADQLIRTKPERSSFSISRKRPE